jgi:hypothetical protein
MAHRRVLEAASEKATIPALRGKGGDQRGARPPRGDVGDGVVVAEGGAENSGTCGDEGSPGGKRVKAKFMKDPPIPIVQGLSLL